VINPVLTTERLVLRTLTTSDVTDDYVGWLNDPEVNRYLESRFIEHRHDNVVAFIERVVAHPSNLFLGIFLKQKMKHIGNIKLDYFDVRHKRAEIGLMIGDQNAWGKGYATEAIVEVVRYGFAELELQKITAGCYESNVGSKKAFEKVGFQNEGFLRSHVVSDCGREGVWRLGILPGELRN